MLSVEMALVCGETIFRFKRQYYTMKIHYDRFVKIGCQCQPLISIIARGIKNFLDPSQSVEKFLRFRHKWARLDSNQEPFGYKPNALTIELRAPQTIEMQHAHLQIG